LHIRYLSAVYSMFYFTATLNSKLLIPKSEALISVPKYINFVNTNLIHHHGRNKNASML